MVRAWDPEFVTLNDWGALAASTLTDPKVREDGLALISELD